MRKSSVLISILILVLSASGCINYEQETFLNQDMSGHIHIHISISPEPFTSNLISKGLEAADIKTNLQPTAPKAATKANIKCEIKEENFLTAFNTRTIKNKSFRMAEENGAAHFYFDADFDDITALYADKEKISIKEGEGGMVTYEEHFKAADGSKESNTYAADLFKGYYFRYTVHMPRNIVSANTADIYKNTATWDIPLPDFMRQKDFTATVTIEPPGNLLKWKNKILKKKTL